ncbi:unnamed protein product [Rhodiola kirilowii]
MSRPGDWSCRSCNHLNFQRRDSCQKCGDPRQSGGIVDYSTIFGGGRLTGGSAFVFATGPDVRPGDWYCSVRNCGAHNFANRSNCFKCGALKEELSAGGGFETEFGRGKGLFGSSTGSGRNGWKSGDWLCNRPGCNEHNFANRMECFRCNAPREI